MPVLVALLAYLLGSVSFGVLYSRWRGADVRDRDLPGTSGMYRQYGLGIAAAIMLADLLKGVLAAALALWLAPDWSPLAVAAVVAGHCYPLFFGLNGGGGIAPLIGALLPLAPLTLLLTLLAGVLLIPLYKATLQPLLKLNAIPAATALALPLGLLLAWRFGGFLDLLAGGLVMLLRALHLLMQRPVPQT